MKKNLLILLCFFLFNCKNEKKEEKIKPEKTISLVEMGNLNFWKSYADHQYLSDKEYEELKKSNATLENPAEPKLLKKLDSLKIVKNNELLQGRFNENPQQGKFNLNPTQKSGYLDKDNKIEFTANFTESTSINIKVIADKKTIHKNIDFGNSFFVGLVLEDLDNDDIKEIIILDYVYFMNGDHYLMKILKLKQ